MFLADMLYDGTKLNWTGQAVYPASSGLQGHQNSSEQSHMDEGPIPEGLYSFQLIIAKDATMVGPGKLDTREGIEHLAGKWEYRGKTYVDQAWGPDRVRLSIIKIDDAKNRHRNGFYLHDSTKGYSHGCIEVSPLFFKRLRDYVKLPRKTRGNKSKLYVRVKYPSKSASTYGGTKVP